jgi:hypothetical protein
MTNQHPITPPPELVDKWHDEWLNADELAYLDTSVAAKAARWGADQELEACCEALRVRGAASEMIKYLRTNRRPNPPTLKEQALAALENDDIDVYLIRRALEALPND